MATPSAQLDQLIATTFDKVRPKLVDQITHETALMQALNLSASITEDGGLTLRRPVMYGLNSTPASYSGYDLIDTTPQTGFGYAEYQWRQFAGSITISGEEIRKNAGAAQIIGLVAAKIDQLRMSFEDEINLMLWADGTGNGGKDLLGIQAIIANTGILGGIDPTDATWWKSQVVATGLDLTDPMGVKTLNNLYNTLRVNRSKPDWEFTTQANFEAYEALAVPNIRFQDLRMADFGFEVVSHKRAEVVFEPDVPAPGGSGGGYWYLINSKHLELVKHSACWMKRLPFQQPYNQDAQVSLVLSMGQLLTDCRRAHGVFTVTTV